MVLKVYAVGGSQPSRAIMWLLRMKGVQHEFIRTIPPKDTRTAEYKEISVPLTVPAISDSGFCVWESAAIMTYLADKHGWDDLYPRDIKLRADVDQWLHWHHRNTREVQIAYCMPIMRPDLVAKGLWNKSSVSVARRALKTLDGELGKRQWIAAGRFTLADIQIYQDVGQCQSSYMNVIDFSHLPNVSRWMKDFESLPSFAYLHKILTKISQYYKRGPGSTTAKL